MSKLFKVLVENAIHAGSPGAEQALETVKKWVEHSKTAVHMGRKFFGAVNIALGVKSLVEAIKKDDWHGIISSAASIAGGAIEVAEGAELISSSTAAMAGASVMTIWITADTILTAAEVAHWFREEEEKDAFLSLVSDARKIVPKGKKLAAALDKQEQTEDGKDSLDADDNERYGKYVEKYAQEVRSDLKKLLDRHFNSSAKTTVGGYPELIKPALPMIKRAVELMNVFDDIPRVVSEGFETICEAIKMMTSLEAATNNPDG